MIEVTAAVNLRGLRRGDTAVVDETDETTKKYIRAGYLIPTPIDAPAVTPKPPTAKKEKAP